MVRTAFVMVLLAALAGAAPVSAAPAWWFWLRKPETHGSRKLAGDFTHARGSYRYHSRERQGLLSFLHPRRPNKVAARHRKSHSGAAPRRARHMSW